jgi:uncharacterized membrane protein YebE (DUF533 family)
MNPIEILGGLLGGKGRGGDSAAADILGEILGGGRSSSAPARQSNTPSAGALEDMLGVGRGSSPSRSAPAPAPRPAPVPQAAPRSSTSTQHQGFPGDIFGQRTQQTQVNVAIAKPALPSQHDQAVLMIRAMVNAAKVDGEITQDEQQTILDQVGDTSQETIQFLRTEFARQINVREFADSIPVGLEQKIYLLSLMSMKLDSKAEADYLRSLATLLRISPEELATIHQQQNAPQVYA